MALEVKILQFGEGNFLRGYFDWMVQRMNDRAGFNGAVEIVQPRGTELRDASKVLNARGGSYHVCLRGLMGGRRVETLERIDCVRAVHLAAEIEQLAIVPSLRFVVSNTTEAGIQHVKGADTFPAKVLRLLRARFAAGLGGLVFIPCELIERNGEELKRCVLAHLDDESPDGTADLRRWIDDECVFCSTLVDRIVSGRPDDESAARYENELGECDEALVCGEPFHFLAVETPADYDLEAELPLAKAGVDVVYTRDLAPYRTRKVRFLNAAHTTIVRLGLEKGLETVAEVVSDSELGPFLRRILFEEIYPTVDLPDAEKTAYAESVLERFANPFANHRLESIALNSAAKWKARCLPVVCDYFRLRGRMPEGLLRGYDAHARHFDSTR